MCFQFIDVSKVRVKDFGQPLVAKFLKTILKEIFFNAKFVISQVILSS